MTEINRKQGKERYKMEIKLNKVRKRMNTWENRNQSSFESRSKICFIARRQNIGERSVNGRQYKAKNGGLWKW